MDQELEIMMERSVEEHRYLVMLKTLIITEEKKQEKEQKPMLRTLQNSGMKNMIVRSLRKEIIKVVNNLRRKIKGDKGG